MIYKQDALELLELLYRSNNAQQRVIAYHRLYELITLLLPDKPEEDEK